MDQVSTTVQVEVTEEDVKQALDELNTEAKRALERCIGRGEDGAKTLNYVNKFISRFKKILLTGLYNRCLQIWLRGRYLDRKERALELTSRAHQNPAESIARTAEVWPQKDVLMVKVWQKSPKRESANMI